MDGVERQEWIEAARTVGSRGATVGSWAADVVLYLLVLVGGGAIAVVCGYNVPAPPRADIEPPAIIANGATLFFFVLPLTVVAAGWGYVVARAALHLSGVAFARLAGVLGAHTVALVVALALVRAHIHY